MIEKVLSSLQLNPKEIQVYLTLIACASAPASVIAKRVGINRSTSQYTCHQLVKKGLITGLNKGGTVFYTAEHPEKLLHLIEKEKELLIQKKEKVKQIMGTLLSLKNPHAKMPNITFYEGVDGLINLFNKGLKEKGNFYGVLRFDEDTDPAFYEYRDTIYVPTRKIQKNKGFFLFNDSENSVAYQKKMENEKLTNIQIIPQKMFPLDICIHIYKTKVILFSWKKSCLIGMEIEDSAIKQTLYSMFHMGWEYAKTYSINEKYKNVTLPNILT